MNKSIDDLGVINIAPLQTFQEFMPKSIPNSIFLNECSTFQVTQIINELETGKSSDIPIKVIDIYITFLFFIYIILLL